MSALLKVSLLVLAAISFHIAFNPPNWRSEGDDRVNKPSFFEKSPRLYGVILQIVVTVYLAVECAIILVLYFEVPHSSAIVSTVCGNPSLSLTDVSVLSPIFFVGIGMIHLAAAGRLWCYRTLGRHFTFAITIKRDHKLITSGPYAIVRHPSYTAGLTMIVGMLLVILGPHGYMNECRLLSTPVRWIFLAWFAVVGYFVSSMMRRGKIEDAGLKQEFGKSWEAYSRSVRYKFVPGLI